MIAFLSKRKSIISIFFICNVIQMGLALNLAVYISKTGLKRGHNATFCQELTSQARQHFGPNEITVDFK